MVSDISTQFLFFSDGTLYNAIRSKDEFAKLFEFIYDLTSSVSMKRKKKPNFPKIMRLRFFQPILISFPEKKIYF